MSRPARPKKAAKMSSQAYTSKELEKLLRLVCADILQGQISPAQIWIDKTGGKKQEPYIRISAKRFRRGLGFIDAKTHAREGEGNLPTTTTTSNRIVGAAIDFFGEGGYDLAVAVTDGLQSTSVRAELWRAGVGLVDDLPVPAEMPYSDENGRKERTRLEFNLSTGKTTKTAANYIEFIELKSLSLGINETAQITGGNP